MDRKRRGVVDCHDFKRLYSSLGFLCREEEYQRLLDLISLHPGGNLNYAEFVDVVENNGKRKEGMQTANVWVSYMICIPDVWPFGGKLALCWFFLSPLTDQSSSMHSSPLKHATSGQTCLRSATLTEGYTDIQRMILWIVQGSRPVPHFPIRCCASLTRTATVGSIKRAWGDFCSPMPSLWDLMSLSSSGWGKRFPAEAAQLVKGPCLCQPQFLTSFWQVRPREAGLCSGLWLPRKAGVSSRGGTHASEPEAEPNCCPTGHWQTSFLRYCLTRVYKVSEEE